MQADQILIENILEVTCTGSNKDGGFDYWYESEQVPFVTVALWQWLERWQQQHNDLRNHPDGLYHAVSTVVAEMKAQSHPVPSSA